MRISSIILDATKSYRFLVFFIKYVAIVIFRIYFFNTLFFQESHRIKKKKKGTVLADLVVFWNRERPEDLKGDPADPEWVTRATAPPRFYFIISRANWIYTVGPLALCKSRGDVAILFPVRWKAAISLESLDRFSPFRRLSGSLVPTFQHFVDAITNFIELVAHRVPRSKGSKKNVVSPRVLQW